MRHPVLSARGLRSVARACHTGQRERGERAELAERSKLLLTHGGGAFNRALRSRRCPSRVGAADAEPGRVPDAGRQRRPKPDASAVRRNPVSSAAAFRRQKCLSMSAHDRQRACGVASARAGMERVN